MMGGNIKAMLQVYTTKKNEIGYANKVWQDVMSFKGFLDLTSGDSKYTTYNAKMQESTHIFICDYQPIPEFIEVDGKLVEVTSENTRMMVDLREYDIMLMDNPMELNQHWEFYLKYTGGQ